MATRITDATAAAAALGAMEIPVNDAGADKKLTVSQLNAYIEPISKATTAGQTTITGNADVYLVNSGIAIPETRLQVGTFIRWKIFVSKTAAGTAAPVFTFRHGTAQSTADTSRGAVTCSAQTATLNSGCIIDCMATFRAVGASAVLQFGVGQGVAGFSTQGGVATSATFNSAVSGMFLGISINPGASAAWTVSQVHVDLLNVL